MTDDIRIPNDATIMLQDEIYILTGETGKHSDHLRWMVSAYLSKEQAIAHMEKAQVYSDRFDYDKDAFAPDPALDPYAILDYTGITYSVMTVSLRTESP